MLYLVLSAEALVRLGEQRLHDAWAFIDRAGRVALWHAFQGRASLRAAKKRDPGNVGWWLRCNRIPAYQVVEVPPLCGDCD